METILIAFLFGAVVYFFMEAQVRNYRQQKAQIERQAKLRRQREEELARETARQLLISELKQTSETDAVRTEVALLRQAKTTQNIKDITENTLIEQALIRQHRGRPEQTDHIDQSLRQPTAAISNIQTNLISAG